MVDRIIENANNMMWPGALVVTVLILSVTAVVIVWVRSMWSHKS